MHIESTIVVSQPRDVAWSFLVNPYNAPKWDRSVAAVVVSPPTDVGIGTEVETIAPSGTRQRFRIVECEATRKLRFTLLASRLFRTADLTFQLESTPDGTRITHEIDFTLRFYALPLYIVILLTNRKALTTDLGFLSRALQEA